MLILREGGWANADPKGGWVGKCITPACGKNMAAAIGASSIDVYSDDEITEI